MVASSLVQDDEDYLLQSSDEEDVDEPSVILRPSKQRRQGVFPSLPAPHVYQDTYQSYSKQWKEHLSQKESHVEITDLESVELDGVGHLVAATSSGHLAVWTTTSSAGEPKQKVLLPKLQVSTRPLTSIEILQSSGGKSCTVVFAGEEGMGLIGFEDLLAGKSSDDNITMFEQVTGIAKTKLLSNDSVIALQTNGSLLQCNLELQKSVANIKPLGSSAKGRRSESSRLSMDAMASSSSSPSNHPLVFVGDVSSPIVSIWDVNQSKQVDSISLLPKGGSSTSPTKKKKPTFIFGSSAPKEVLPTEVSAISVTDPWWTIAGIKEDGSGMLSTFHGPTRTLVSSVDTRETISGILCSPKSTELVTIGNEGVISEWSNPYSSLERSHRIWSSAPCNMAICSTTDGEFAVAGVGPHVDLISDHCKARTLSL